MKICVFGGAFDPLHLGHENLVEILLERFNKVVIMPSKITPGKMGPIASDIDRLNMLSLCNFAKNPNLVIDDYEIKNDSSPSFTINSIKYIKSKFKEYNNIYLALGLDQLNNLSNWRDIKSLLSIVNIICFNRNGFQEQKNEFEHELVEDFNCNISSSNIRNLIKSDFNKIKNMVNKDVFNYIIKENLYQ